MQNHKLYCTECRVVMSDGGSCPQHHEMKIAPQKWYGPKKSNLKAWRLIASGKIWWDKKKVERFNELVAQSIENTKSFLKRKRSNHGSPKSRSS